MSAKREPYEAIKVTDWGQRGDSPRETAGRGVFKGLTEEIISLGECFGLPATLGVLSMTEMSGLDREITPRGTGLPSPGATIGLEP